MTTTTTHDCEVAIVGFGPVGEVLAILLAQLGHRVIVLERHAEPYGRPRAVHFDDETARILALCGVGEHFGEIGSPGAEYEWRNARGDTLLRFDYDGPGPSGWPQATMFNQAALEDKLERRAVELDTVTVLRGHEVIEVRDDGDHVTVDANGPGGPVRLTASWIVGCDGANSVVRARAGIGMHDLGFFYDWLICDVILREPREFSPVNLQICDPHRPTTQVSSGPGRRRWEFMRIPDESVDDLSTAAAAWTLLASFDVRPDNAVLERHAVYTFQARFADRWRVGRLLIAGDAAHLMPPFAGQGMCSGLRDAVNLAWKLDWVLTGSATDELLDTYTTERSAHVRHAMEMSIELGKIICLPDVAAAQRRDAHMLAFGGDPAKVLPPLPEPVLGPGLTASGGGRLMPQGLVRMGGRVGRFDELIGTGGWLLLRHSTLGPSLAPSSRAHLDRLGFGVAATDVLDNDGTYELLFARLDVCAILVRPDFWIFGTAARPEMIDDLVAELVGRLTADRNVDPT